MDQVQKMGPLDQIIKMIPGLGNNPALKNIQIPEKQISHIKAIVYSMTPEERENPDILNPSRRRRIAAGSGRSIAEVNRMIKQFKQSKEMTKGDMGEFANLPGMNSPMGKMAMRSMNKRFKKNKKKRMKKIKRYRSK